METYTYKGMPPHPRETNNREYNDVASGVDSVIAIKAIYNMEEITKKKWKSQVQIVIPDP